jgi:hypothetical protein
MTLEQSTPVSHHADTFTVGTNPGWTIAHTPYIVLEAGITYLKAAGTTPAEFFRLFAAMTDIFTQLFASISRFLHNSIVTTYGEGSDVM